MTIYNRWGDVVFLTDKLGKGWDGNDYNAKEESKSMMDTYIYTIKLVNVLGEKFDYEGEVHLIR